MSSSTFWRTVICGIIATFVMMMLAFVQGGFGLATLDIGHILKESFNHVHSGEPYSILWGNVAFYIMGIILALIWVAFLASRIPGNWLVQGLIYGVIISVVAGGIVSPLITAAAGDPIGLFYSDSWAPMALIIAGLIMHLGYGIVLTLCLKKAGVDPKLALR
ncbi:MAG: hypothetical protein EA391_13670 [Balneolaceae bacterium]|nr:MAG: hypothetical protein EA391_13670 [Balneolaceae bacterium]